MKVLVCDPIAQTAVDKMKAAGLEVVEKTDLSPEELVETIGGYEAAVVRSATKLRANVLEAAKNLKLVVRGGVGLDNIDLNKAKELGIEVRNTPAASSASVAELAIAHMFSLSRYIFASNLTMKMGKWNKKHYKGIELGGKTLGIVGIGRIGQELAKRAFALGMNIIAFDKFIKESPLPDVVKMVDFDYLLANSNYVSLHIPFIKAEGPTIGAEELKKMRKDAYLINCARGGAVDEAALVKALDNDQIAGAGVDVYEEEPPGKSPLIIHPKVSITPHIGASTLEAQVRVGEELSDIIIEFSKK
jgi:D-3-phosphoglycerate dehydrogenase